MLEIAQFLLANGANPHERPSGFTSLVTPSSVYERAKGRGEDDPWFKLFGQYSPLDLNHTYIPDQEMQPLIKVCESGDLDEVKRLATKENVNYPYLGLTPFQAACYHKQTKIAEHLLTIGAILEHRALSETPLLLACTQTAETQEENSGIVRLLVEHGAKPSLCDADGNSPLSVSEENEEITSILKKYGILQQGANLLCKACREGDLKKVIALASSENVNFPPTSGLSPLQTACYYNQTESTEHLLKLGAKLECRDSKGRTPLILACMEPETPASREPEKTKTKSIGIFRKRSAKTPAPVVKDNTDKQLVVKDKTDKQRENNLGVVRLLLAYGAKRDVKDNSRNTPLSLSKPKGKVRILLLM